MVDLCAHEAGNGGQGQGRPTAQAVLFYSEAYAIASVRVNLDRLVDRSTEADLSVQIRPEFLECDSKDWPVITDNLGIVHRRNENNALPIDLLPEYNRCHGQDRQISTPK